MQKLVQGIHHFQNEVFASRKELFDRLSQGQEPDTLFITCCDSRIDPNLVTQTEPGELFILHNIGNLVPTFSRDDGGVGAAVEYAVNALGVKNIIVCGHTLCGAMNGLLDKSKLGELPVVSKWLDHAEPTLQLIRKNYGHLQGDALKLATIQENVLNQLENLATHPAVAARLAKGELHLHGWVYKIETGEIFSYDPRQEQFVALSQPTPVLNPGRKQTVNATD